MGEHLLCKQRVIGSSPFTSTFGTPENPVETTVSPVFSGVFSFAGSEPLVGFHGRLAPGQRTDSILGVLIPKAFPRPTGNAAPQLHAPIRAATSILI